MFKNIPIKILSINGNFVLLRYLNSNAKTRIKKDRFINSCECGELDVQNIDLLPVDLRAKLEK